MTPTEPRDGSADGGGGLCLVLGAGGFRGVAHAGVLRALRRSEAPVRSIVGASIGGLVAAFHASLGLDPERIAERLSGLTTPALFSLGVALRRWGPLSRRARRATAPLLEELERLKACSLDRLHFGVEKLGLLAMNLPSLEEVFATTGLSSPFSLYSLALGGASIPLLFPWVKVTIPGRTYRLVDGGLSHSVPVERAYDPPFSADQVLAVDLQVIRGIREREADRWERLHETHGSSLIRLLPKVEDAGTVFFRSESGAELLRAGEEAVTGEILRRIQSRCGPSRPAASGLPS